MPKSADATSARMDFMQSVDSRFLSVDCCLESVGASGIDRRGQDMGQSVSKLTIYFVGPLPSDDFVQIDSEARLMFAQNGVTPLKRHDSDAGLISKFIPAVASKRDHTRMEISFAPEDHARVVQLATAMTDDAKLAVRYKLLGAPMPGHTPRMPDRPVPCLRARAGVQ